MKECPVCSRKLKNANPQKGDVAWETTYCTHYCRLFDENKLEKVPFKGGNKHHNNKLAWPHINIPCDMCDNEATLRHDIERGNGRYCSRSCWHKLKSCQKRKIHQTINILHFLEHDYKYGGHQYISSALIAEKCGLKGASLAKSSVGGMMKRWREAGIVEAKLRSGASASYDYRFHPEGLRGMKVSQFIYSWNTMSYAEKIAFKQT